MMKIGVRVTGVHCDLGHEFVNNSAEIIVAFLLEYSYQGLSIHRTINQELFQLHLKKGTIQLNIEHIDSCLTALGLRQALHNSPQGPPTSHSAKVEVDWSSGQVGRTKLSSTDLLLPRAVPHCSPRSVPSELTSFVGRSTTWTRL